MNIIIRLMYLSQDMTRVKMAVSVDDGQVFEGQFEWFDVFIRALIPIIESNYSNEVTFYIPNEEEAILANVNSDSLSISIVDEKPVEQELSKLEGDWWDLRQISNHLALKMPVISTLNLPYPFAVLVVLTIVDRYQLDVNNGAEKLSDDKKSPLETFFEYYQKVRERLRSLFENEARHLHVTVISAGSMRGHVESAGESRQ